MDHRDGATTPPYLSGYRGYRYGVDSPHRASIRSSSSFPGASGSVSSFHDNLQPSPRGTVPQTNSRAVVSALKGLQEKIRKLELERADAEDNLKKLATESRHYKDALQKELTVRESTQGVIAKQNKGINLKVTVLLYCKFGWRFCGRVVNIDARWSPLGFSAVKIH
ncbi:centrosomal protein CEP57L1-like [Orbicella faveolata]|uniref:centrosomal protein CEP57L1-like n=1 Tax=Orbicella faveolata TaxID=48498 RepID=UPI0009E52418|nr:centrosomal protein CEP57L1-like [Orbicella faveolata]